MAATIFSRLVGICRPLCLIISLAFFISVLRGVQDEPASGQQVSGSALHYRPSDAAEWRPRDASFDTSRLNYELRRRALLTFTPRQWLDARSWTETKDAPAGINKAMVEQLAQEFYEAVETQLLPSETTMVAALWVPCENQVYFGSTPHSLPADVQGQMFDQAVEDDKPIPTIPDGQAELTKNAPKFAPVLWSKIKDRVPLDRSGRVVPKSRDTTLWHAEDLTCYWFELENKSGSKSMAGRTTYPDDSFITAYGRYGSRDKPAGRRSLCGQGTNARGARIRPACAAAMSSLGITYDR